MHKKKIKFHPTGWTVTWSQVVTATAKTKTKNKLMSKYVEIKNLIILHIAIQQLKSKFTQKGRKIK